MKEDIKEIKNLMKFLVKQKVREVVEKNISGAKEKKVYDLTGVKKRETIQKETGFSAGKISGLWNKWEQLGIIIKEGKNYKKII